MILIVGCGCLGNYLIKHIRSVSDDPVIATVRNIENVVDFPGVEYVRCDLTVEKDLINLKNRIGDNKLKVFYLAAYHNIDGVYKNPEEAEKTNITALERFVDEVEGIESLFYASTDCVYGESKESTCVFSENSELNPINVYGRQKADAEKIILNHGFNVIRFSLLFGPSLSEKKNFYDILRKDLLSGKQTEMIDGMSRQVLSYADAAKYMYELSLIDRKNLFSVVNVCGDKGYTKYDMGCIIADKLNVSRTLICKVSEEQGSNFFADRRASNIVMDNSLMKALLNIDTALWEETKC